ncbi:MAG: pilus assembly protein TadG-related protein [Silvibacterium sp.]
MKFLRDESGQMLVLTALSMTALLGFLALSTDVGMLFHTRRNLQIAADAAATAGALNISYGASASAAGQAAATANGVTNGVNGAVVTINTPPTSGYHQSTGYVEAIVTTPNPTFFMKLFNIGSMNVSARAVGGAPGAANGCVYLDGTTGDDLIIKGSGTIEGPNGGPTCGIYDNAGIKVTGNGNTVTASYIDVVASAPDGNGTAQGTTTNYSSPAESNPFGTTVSGGEPTVPSGCTQTISTATYTSTTSFASGSVVCFSASNVNVSGATLTGLGSGATFVFENGVVAAGVGGNTTINNGTMDINGGTFLQDTNSNLNITAPTTLGQWNNGIAVLVPPGNTSYTPTGANVLTIQFGSSNQTLSGYIYAPNVQLSLHDHGGGVTATGIVAANLSVLSGVVSLPSYNAANPLTTPLRVVSLVE